MPWEETDRYIRSGHEDPDKYETCRTIDISEEEGIKAIYCKLKGKDEWEIQSYLFDKEKGWTMDKAKDWFNKHKESKATRLRIQEKLVPFKFKALAAVPGKSLNNRIYTPEVLQQAAPNYKGKPFILDHDYTSSEKVIGVITDSYYRDGLWVEGLGLMHEELFEKVKGTDKVPPLIKGVSIGGEGEGSLTQGGILINRFTPEELSLTAFPGIPDAQLIEIEAIREHYINKSEGEKMKEIKEIKTTDEHVTDIPLETAEEMAKNAPKLAEQVLEADIPSSPDSKRFQPPQVAPGNPAMGGPQTGGIAQPSTPKPPQEKAEDEAVQVVASRTMAVPPGQIAPQPEAAAQKDIIRRAQEILNEMQGDAKKAYWKIAKEILEGFAVQ